MFAFLPQRRSLLVPVAAVMLLSSTPAAAHIDLLEPEARAHGTAARGDMQIDDNSNLKSGPCGQVTSGRSARVATYEPGQTLTVRVREENAHVSYLRVALALDGESFPLRSEVPAAPETQEEVNAAEAALVGPGLLAVVRENSDTPGFVHEIEVTLPEATCQRCTLQVLQLMYDDPAAPYYFQCADLVIADAAVVPDAGGSVPEAMGDGSGRGTSPATQGAPPSGAMAGAAPSAARPAAEPRAEDAAGSAAAAPRAPAAAAPAAMSEAGGDSGCNLSTGAARPGSAGVGAGLIALGLALSCRRSNRAASQRRA
jgi:hypothetical protein